MVQNYFSVKKILMGKTNLQDQYFVSNKFQGEGTFSVPKKYWLHKIVKYFWVRKIFEYEKIFEDEKIFE